MFIKCFFYVISHKMPAKTISVSIPEDQMVFLDENPTLKPSQLLQVKINEVQMNMRHNPQLIEANKNIAQLQKLREKLQAELQHATEFITIKGMWEEYIK